MTIVRAAVPGFPAVETVYFGGGTPSLMSSGQVGRILDALNRAFSIDANAEITLEINPGTVTAGKLKAFRRLGISRVSIGIQSLDDRLLRKLGRGHTAAEAVRTVQMAGRAGFLNTGIDLIYGIPGQSFPVWLGTLDEAVRLTPVHISAYVLSWNQKTAVGQKIESGRWRAPDEDRIADMYLRTSDRLQSAGYEHYEISNFARSGYRCRHNEGYWNGTPYLGFGPSAHSYYNHMRSWNVQDMSRYIRMTDQGSRPLAGAEVIGPDQRDTEYLALGLRCSDGIRIQRLNPLQQKRVSDLDKQFIRIWNDRLSLTPAGYLVADEVALRLMA